VPTVEEVKIWVLGTLEVSHGGRAVDVRGQLPRRLLALLALTPGHEVSADRLMHGLWGAEPPAAAAATLQSHVARLRRDLGLPDVVRTGRHGYVLDVTPDDVDALVLEREVTLGGTALLDGRVDEAGTILADALSLWRGRPYAEFSGCELLETESERLCALRLDALEGRISADLGRSGIAPPVAELEALVRWHPMRESFWALLMCAQYRAGRQADALASYQRARSTLADELGIDPGPALQELERLILAQDPSMDGPAVSAFLPTRLDRGSYHDRVALLERDDLLGTLQGLHAEAMAGFGRLVLVHGEAGVGKSALVRDWAAVAASQSPVLWGACDPLSSPRPLGPLVDVAPHLDPHVDELLRSGERDGLFEAALAALEAKSPAVLMIEDLHWADMSTLDLLRFLARRLEGTHVLVVATYRDDHLQPSDPVRVMLGDIASQSVVRRVEVPLLSPAAVAELAAESGIDAVALHRETGGNAFFVTEVVAAGGSQLPTTVQDAVLARVQRLSPLAQRALETAAVVGSRVEPALVHGLPDVTTEAVDECVAAGMLRFEPPAYGFRHEIVRQAVLSGVTPGRLGALHWQVLDRLRAMPMSPRPFARLAEHAEMAGDGPATLEFAVAAGDAAASLGSHREAAFQYGRAMPYAGLLDADARIELLTKRATECQTSDEHEHAIAAWEEALVLLRAAGRDLEAVEALLGMDESYYTIGDNSRGTELVDAALAVLDGVGPCRQLALAISRRGTHHKRSFEFAESLPWLDRANAMGGEIGDYEVVSRALSNKGVAIWFLGRHAEAQALIRESLQVALAHDLEDCVAQNYQTLSWSYFMDEDLVEAHAQLEEAERYTAERDLHGQLLCVLASEISLKVALGRWDEAAAQAHDLLYVRNTGRASRIEPLVALGLLSARRGDADGVWGPLDEARDHIGKTQNLNYQGFIAQSRGEVYLLDGDVERIRAEVLPWYEEAVRLGDEDYVAELTMLVWRAGLVDESPEGLREPERLTMAGNHRQAAELFSSHNRPYKAAWALLDSDDEVDLREARARFDQLGAKALVERTDAKLRAIGAKVPRGPRPSTRANVGGLTDREMEVLELLDGGLRNAEIAAKLHLSEKTVGHHVSAILAKLGVSSRLEAVRRARDLTAVG
jgi:DNA-binding SARP family transcriptional activator/DNA-binding CsgD family transcriptional regulator/tetratricopeptide (TPR) repeat protein